MSNRYTERRDEGIGTLLKALIALNVVVFVAWNRLPPEQLSLMIDHFVLSNDRVFSGKIWTLFTCFVSHVDATHLLFNMFGLYVFGRPVRMVIGDKGILTLYIAGGLCASLGYILSGIITGVDPGAVGASGSVMAIAVVFATLFPNTTLLVNFFIPVKAWIAVILFIGIDLVGAFGITGIDQVLSPGINIAHAAHLGGAAFGLLYYTLRLRPRLQRRGRPN
jgi:membrane associated rhomboid family serine protease